MRVLPGQLLSPAHPVQQLRLPEVGDGDCLEAPHLHLLPLQHPLQRQGETEQGTHLLRNAMSGEGALNRFAIEGEFKSR